MVLFNDYLSEYLLFQKQVKKMKLPEKDIRLVNRLTLRLTRDLQFELYSMFNNYLFSEKKKGAYAI